MDSVKRTTILDRLMILGILLLVCSPLLAWMISPADWYYAIALENQQRGNLDRAREIYQKIVARNPNQSMALFRLGELAFRDEDLEAALDYADRALVLAGPARKPAILNLLINSLIGLGRSQAAVNAAEQLYEYTSLPREFDDLDAAGLLPFLGVSANRQFLNSLAYTMAVSGHDPEQAEIYINAVIRYYEKRVDNARLTIPYLYERSSHHQQAFQQLRELAAAFEVDPADPDDRDSIGEETDRASELLENQGQGQADGKQAAEARSSDDSSLPQFRIPVNRDDRRFLYRVLNRLKLLADELAPEEAPGYAAALEKLRSEELHPLELRIEVDDQYFLKIAYELRHYYDTRAIVRLAVGDRITAESVINLENNIAGFVEASDRAAAYYRAGYRDLITSIELRSAMKAYRQRFPDNSLMITLPSDRQEFQREEQRLQAVEYYHRYLLLIALNRLDEAEDWLPRINDLGYQPGPTLF